MHDKCKICANHLSELNTCKFCHFEYDPKVIDDDWDIFKLDWNLDIHKDILHRLWAKGIECIHADIWYDDDTAYLLGCFDNPSKIADALNLHDDVVYGNLENGLVVLNLFKEKWIRNERKS